MAKAKSVRSKKAEAPVAPPPKEKGNRDLLLLVDALAREKNVPKDIVFTALESALATIDLRTHTGVHPRIGAVDVVPFVPLEGATMAACVELAMEVAAEVAARFELPVYLYEDAARLPERRRDPTRWTSSRSSRNSATPARRFRSPSEAVSCGPAAAGHSARGAARTSRPP